MAKADLFIIDEVKDYDFPDRCCEEDFGGSHYHCAKCGTVGGMMGCGRRHGEDLCPPVEERTPAALRFVPVCDDCGRTDGHDPDCFWHGPH